MYVDSCHAFLEKPQNDTLKAGRQCGRNPKTDQRAGEHERHESL
jgi:hypothetical protein